LKKKKVKFLIQVGANDGIRFDILNSYIKKYKINSLLVEPIKENFENLKKNYQGCDFVKFENSAISVNDEIHYLYKVNSKNFENYDNHIPGISSFNINHLLKHGVKKNHIIKDKVNSLSIKNLINKYNLETFDLLYVDAEGYDGNIVNDFLETTKIKPIIILEYIHINNNIFKRLINNLEFNNYKFFSINENLICYPEEDLEYLIFN
jgi:FkbM family methyltransferase